MSVVLWTQLAWKASMAANGGTVVNIASIGGLATEHGIGYYNATKAAVIHLTRQFAVELAPGVRVNAIAPGVVRTAPGQGAVGEQRGAAERERCRCAGSASRRTSPRPRVFLAGDDSSWMTGQTLVIDGGARVHAAGSTQLKLGKDARAMVESLGDHASADRCAAGRSTATWSSPCPTSATPTCGRPRRRAPTRSRRWRWSPSGRPAAPGHRDRPGLHARPRPARDDGGDHRRTRAGPVRAGHRQSSPVIVQDWNAAEFTEPFAPHPRHAAVPARRVGRREGRRRTRPFSVQQVQAGTAARAAAEDHAGRAAPGHAASWRRPRPTARSPTGWPRPTCATVRAEIGHGRRAGGPGLRLPDRRRGGGQGFGPDADQQLPDRARLRGVPRLAGPRRGTWPDAPAWAAGDRATAPTRPSRTRWSTTWSCTAARPLPRAGARVRGTTAWTPRRSRCCRPGPTRSRWSGAGPRDRTAA